ncbi:MULTISPECIES: hypothetical protein [Mycetohabitans]|nr:MULTISPECIES: hypothetical protein [Mycetohabitans]MCG1047662.1 hypothetical protein [Mycetohabitans sp. B6]
MRQPRYLARRRRITKKRALSTLGAAGKIRSSIRGLYSGAQLRRPSTQNIEE